MNTELLEIFIGSILIVQVFGVSIIGMVTLILKIYVIVQVSSVYFHVT